MESIKGRVTVRTEDSEPVARAVVPCGSVADSAALEETIQGIINEELRKDKPSRLILCRRIMSALPSGANNRPITPLKTAQ